MEFYQAGRKEGDFERGIEMVLTRILADPRFIYRIETEPRRRKRTSPIASAISIWRRACPSSCGAASPTRN
jgi:hypothetical protein